MRRHLVAAARRRLARPLRFHPGAPSCRGHRGRRDLLAPRPGREWQPCPACKSPSSNEAHRFVCRGVHVPD